MARLCTTGLIAAVLAGCGTAGAPTPQIIYVTPAPTDPAVATASPSASPTPSPSPSSHPFRAISGTFALLGVNGTAYHITATGPGGSPECTGTGGYSDVREGQSVTAKDEAGKIIATSVIKFAGGNTGVCLFTFTLLDIPAVAFYSIEVGHRGGLTYSKADLEAAHWHVDLTLGK